MNSKLILAAMITALVLSACGNGSDTEEAVAAETPAEPVEEQVEEQPAPEPEPEPEEPGAIIEVSDSASWNIKTESAQLTCQRAVMRNPFRAQWFDGPSRIGLTASGFPVEGSDQTRPDNFRLTSLARNEIKNATLEEYSLTVKEVSVDAGLITFEIMAEGTIEGGGKFMASGTCTG